MPLRDPVARAAYHKRWYVLNGRVRSEQRREYFKAYNAQRQPKLRLASKAYKLVLRKKALDRYGSVCQCCGESQYEFLCIDHINGGGEKHRASLNGSSICAWLKKKDIRMAFKFSAITAIWQKHSTESVPTNAESEEVVGELSTEQRAEATEVFMRFLASARSIGFTKMDLMNMVELEYHETSRQPNANRA